MLRRSLVVGAAVIVTLIGLPPLAAQRQRPLTPLPADGLRVSPFFDGWYENADGTFTLSFGYSNLNRHDLVEIPLGPDNFIQPKEYDGRQPTSFPPVVPTPGGDGSGAPGGDRRQRERGVFTITVPAGFQGDVVWTLRHQGRVYSVPGRARSGAYRLQWPMAMGSIPPLVGFSANGPTGRGPVGIQAAPQRIAVGAPLSLMVWTNDDSVREKEPVPVRQRIARPAINVNWYKHSGPGAVVFTPPTTPIAELQGTATTSVVFKAPGDYVIRVRADNFGRVDTSPGNQCCWTNGYVSVLVTP